MFGKINLTTKALSTLQLDTSNPRLLGYKKQGKLQTEKEIVTLMMARYGIRELINSILSNGFYPDEILYAIPDEKSSNKRVIVEDNRRLTACKIIKKPNLLKGTAFSSLIAKIERHPNYSAAVETIKKLHLVELSNRSAARTYIASKHTKESIKRWSVYTQGAYYIDLLSEFEDIIKLRSSINNSVSTSRIRGVILFTRLTDQILELPTLSQEEKECLLNDIDNIKTEAIFRLIQRQDFKDEIAIINLNKQGELVVRKIGQSAYNHLLAKLARDANFTKKLSTRQEDDRKINEYLKELKVIINQFSSVDEVVIEDENEDDDTTFDLNDSDIEIENVDEPLTQHIDDQEHNSITPEPQIKPVQKKKQNVSLLKKTTPFVYDHAKINELILESKTLNINKHKHSAILLSRTLIQVVLSYIIKESSQHQNYRRDSKHNYLELDSLLSFFSNNLKNIFPNEIDNNVYKLIRSDLNSYKESGKLISNLVTHSDQHALTLQEVTHVQVKLQTLMDYFLNKIISGHRAQ
ncbi:hypothetical protein [Enterobacter cloacae]|uniref:hypothetical protein n=1 Tax=Enterobacter cloacae TaxID=550 RepID=UPI0021CEB983|nr:hypothetical protein [Enterobacter cloacae]MCU6413384.1 hypothetical protein [Enterobacter cloacae]